MNLVAGLMVVQRMTAIMLVLAGVVGCLILPGYRGVVEHTLANSRDIDRQFRAFGGAVVLFEAHRHRLPDKEELGKILPVGAYGRYQVELGTDATICGQESPEGRQLQRSAYVLWTWRGEWAECFAPRTGITTVVTREDGQTVLRSIIADQMTFGAITLACFAFAIRLWNPGSWREVQV